MAVLAGESSSFTWSGTFAAVLLPATLAGAALAWAEQRRRAGGGTTWRWTTLTPLLFVAMPAIAQDSFVAGLEINTMSAITGKIYAVTGGNSGIGREQLDAALAAELAQIPLGRFGSADEVARAVVFLLSPDSSYVVGETLAVDGGRSRL